MIEEWGHVRRGYSLPELERLFGSPPLDTRDVHHAGHRDRPRRRLFEAARAAAHSALRDARAADLGGLPAAPPDRSRHGDGVRSGASPADGAPTDRRLAPLGRPPGGLPRLDRAVARGLSRRDVGRLAVRLRRRAEARRGRRGARLRLGPRRRAGPLAPPADRRTADRPARLGLLPARAPPLAGPVRVEQPRGCGPPEAPGRRRSQHSRRTWRRRSARWPERFDGHGCGAILCQEYEYPRFDACVLPRTATANPGLRDVSRWRRASAFRQNGR